MSDIRSALEALAKITEWEGMYLKRNVYWKGPLLRMLLLQEPLKHIGHRCYFGSPWSTKPAQ